jgi:hypothetical protein
MIVITTARQQSPPMEKVVLVFVTTVGMAIIAASMWIRVAPTLVKTEEHVFQMQMEKHILAIVRTTMSGTTVNF